MTMTVQSEPMLQTPTFSNDDLLVVQDLRKYFPVRGGLLQRIQAWVKAVDGELHHQSW